MAATDNPVHCDTQLHQSSARAYPRPDYCNEKVVQRNRLPTRSYYILETPSFLNGKWDFDYAQSLLHAPEPSRSSPLLVDGEGEIVKVGSAWSQIEVPGHWQLQGYGSPQYTHVPLSIPRMPALRTFGEPNWHLSSHILDAAATGRAVALTPEV